MVGAPKEALKDCQAALSLDPKHVRSHLRMGKTLSDLGKLPEALEHMRGAALSVPESHELAQECAKLEHLSGVVAEALALYHGERGRADFNADGAVEASSGEDAGGLLPEALPKITKIEKDFPGALRLFQEAEAAAPSVALQLWVARAAIMCQQCDKAIMLTLQILKNDEQNTEALRVRGRALFFSGDVDQGVRHLRECLRLDPDLKAAGHDLKMMRAVQEGLAKAADCNMKRQFEEQVEVLTQVLARTEYPARAPILASIYSSRARSACASAAP
jgi:DnaJ family protein C protein 7